MIYRPARPTLFPYTTLFRSDSNSVAKALAEVIKKESGFGAIFTGKQAVDDDCAQVSQLLAQFLNIPHGTVSNIKKLRQKLTQDRKSTRLNSSHANISYAVFC